MLTNGEAALAGLFDLENDAIAIHKRVAEYLEGIRLMIDGATVLRWKKVYRITGTRADRGIVIAYGLKCYGKHANKVGVREYNLGDLRECKILKLHAYGDAQPTVRPPEVERPPNHAR